MLAHLQSCHNDHEHFQSPPHGREVLSHGRCRGWKGEASAPAIMRTMLMVTISMMMVMVMMMVTFAMMMIKTHSMTGGNVKSLALKTC